MLEFAEWLRKITLNPFEGSQPVPFMDVEEAYQYWKENLDKEGA